jgi:tetratricopeptide (TPR) repeat protein
LIAVIIFSSGALLVRPAVAQHEHEHPAGDVGKLGRVNFPVSCDAPVQAQFNSAVAMLHSFWYEKANETFAQIAHDDPACAMAYWGIAMTYYHEIWSAPGAADLKAGSAAVEKAKSIGAKTQRERDYISAIESFYKDSDKVDHSTRVLRYEKAMDDLQARYVDDPEARIFYALALLATSR